MTTQNTTTLSSQITGNDYFSAYRSRMQVNNDYFLTVAKELTEQGYSVYVPKDGLISYIHVENADSQISFGFDDVPYRWYLSYSIDHTKGNGSSRRIKEQHDYDTPYTVVDVVANMKPKTPQQLKAAPSYLKLFTI